MRANGVRMSDAVGTVGGEEGARCCGVTLTIGAAACVGKGWERERLAEGWGERFWELESWKYNYRSDGKLAELLTQGTSCLCGSSRGLRHLHPG